MVQLFSPIHGQRRSILRENNKQKFIELLSQKLEKNGEFVLATDSQSYFNYTWIFFHRSDFSRAESREREVTKYEKKGLALGNEIYDVTFKLSQ